MMIRMSDSSFTQMFARLGAKERPTPQFLSSLYAEMRSVADRMMRQERGDHTLQPTALVNEALIRLVDSKKIGEQGRLHFFDAAAVTMRRILVEHARRVGRDKRGGGWERVTFSALDADDPSKEGVDVIALHEALRRLEHLDPRQAKIVELRFFSGMTGQEIADHLGLSRNTVVRELTLSRAWLKQEMDLHSGD